MSDTNGTDHPLERLVFFSDAVFAIAITLLVIEIEVPHLPREASADAFARPLAHLIPSFIGFFISFAVVGMFWVSHHRAFSLARRYDPSVLPWNMALLGMVATMPWFTAFMSSNISARLPTIVYCSALAVAALLNLRVVFTATGPKMAGEMAGTDAAAYVRLRSLSVLLGALTAIAVAALLPIQGQLGLISIPLWRRILAVRKRRPTRTAI